MIYDIDLIRIISFIEIVGCQDNGHLLFFLNLLEQAPDTLPSLDIQACRWLIQKEQVGAIEQGSCNVHPTLLAARKRSIRLLDKG